MSSMLVPIPVTLFGIYGEWATNTWLPSLLPFVKLGLIDLTTVDQWPDAPPVLDTLAQEGIVYLSRKEFVREPVPARLAFVITSPRSHQDVMHYLVNNVRDLRVVVLEKPWGQTRQQAQTIMDLCHQANVTLIPVDHYLLRPPVQHLLAHPRLICDLGPITRITGVLREAKEGGPAQGVIADLCIHLIDLILLLLPDITTFVPCKVYTAHAIHHAHTFEETYCLCLGYIRTPSTPIVPCILECGKQLNDQKGIWIEGECGTIHLDLLSHTLTVSTNEEKERLQWNTPWSYSRLVFLALFSTLASTSELVQSLKT